MAPHQKRRGLWCLLSFSLYVINMKTLRKGNRIKLRGGDDYDPEFLKKPPNIDRTGEVIKFIPGQNKEEAAVVKLDFPITCKGKTGEYLVLELRYVGQTWETDGPVYLELCSFIPDNKKLNDREQGEWVESHASFDIL